MSISDVKILTLKFLSVLLMFQIFLNEPFFSTDYDTFSVKALTL